MILSLLGILLLLLPFSLLFYFKDKKVGFLYVLTGVVLWHTFLALISQYFHFFTHQYILFINLIMSAILIYWLILNKKKASFKIKFNPLLIIALLIIIFQLFSVNYLYTGTINTIDGYKEVTNFSYPYPYFADEWAGVSFTNYSIENNALPIVNPLIDGEEHYNFPNIFIGFFALLAEIFLLINIPPLLGYVPLSIVTGTLLCYLAYLVLKSIKIKELPAIIAMLVIPWAINSAKLPSIWYLFPFILGSIFFLIALSAIHLKEKRLALIANLNSLFFYPPMIVFIAPVLIIEYIFREKITFKKLIKYIFILFGGSALVVALVLIFQPDNFNKLLSLFYSSLIRMNNEGTIPTRYIWQVLPIITLPFAVIGIIRTWQKKYFSLGLSILVGLGFWAAYSNFEKYFIIDYARVAAFASYLLIIASGVGLGYSFELIRKEFKVMNSKALHQALAMLVLAFFIGASFFYTRNDDWKNIRHIYETSRGPWQMPIEAPANNYLNKEDLEIFKNITDARFFTLPWKGLVIGASTNNYPVLAKASTITNFLMHDWVFLEADCYGKDYVAEEHGLKYAYTPPFDCPNFIEIDKSSEGLHLYEYRRQE